MLIKMNFLIILTLIDLSMQTFYSKQDKICDPRGTSWVKYTGFRIHREYIVNGVRTPMIHFNSISHCQNGSVDFERVMNVNKNVDIDFNKPFCLLKPNYTENVNPSNLLLNKLDTGEVELSDYLQINKERKGGTMIRNNIDFYDIANNSEICQVFHDGDLDDQIIANVTKSSDTVSLTSSYLPSGAMQYFSDFSQGLLSRMITRNKIEEYIGRKKFITSKDFEVLTPQQLSQIDFEDDFVCYNLVRRKKYAKRLMGLYAPHRFIGAIYECHVSPEDKQSLMDSYKDSLNTPELKCDSELSKPIAPLISDDISKQWFQISSGAHVMQRIPYLYSPSSMDPRFKENWLSLKGQENWYDGIQVNEDYTYSHLELGKLSHIVTEMSNSIYKSLLGMEKKLLKQDRVDPESNIESRFLSALGLQQEQQLLETLEQLEIAWDDLDI